MKKSGYKAVLGGRAVIIVVVIQRKAHLGSVASSFGEDYTTNLDLQGHLYACVCWFMYLLGAASS